MTENLGRKATLVVALVVAAIACLLFPEKPFRLGLDLQGGTRLEYRFDFKKAKDEGKISQAEFDDKATLLDDFCNITRGRVDPQGVMELSVRKEGNERIVIELPGAAELTVAKTISKLDQAISETDSILTLDGSNPEVVKAFPLSGGVITIGVERIAYAVRNGRALEQLHRGEGNTKSAPHAAGEPVELLSTDDLQKRIENVGDLQFLIVATSGQLTPLGTDHATEKKKLDDWMTAHPGEPVDAFNRLAPEQGGPTKGLRWVPHNVPKGELETPLAQRLALLMLPPEEWIFSGNDLDTVGFDQDRRGYPAVRFEMSPAKKGAFGDFTEKHIEEQMAIVLNGEIVTAPKINTKLPGGGIIEGGGAGFTQAEVKDLITVLRSGSLRIKPELLSKSRVGASLGENYVSTAFTSTLTALGVIVLFMLAYYRKLGLFSVIGLVINLLLMMGALSFLQATLTLPGVAGVILTLGMAVDGNILIFERLREEMGRGLKLVQAVKSAFDRAAVTIVDSNLTTLLAGLILQNVGTGPIRGFAVTLNIGILTTLFTVIVVSQVLIGWDLKRGATSFTMSPTIRSPSFRFMDAARFAFPASIVVLVLGLVLFLRIPNQEKLGIDFLGGFRVTVNTQQPVRVADVDGLVKKIPGVIGESAQVRQVLDSGSRDVGYTQFVIICKLSGEEGADEDTSVKTGEKQIRDALGPILQKDPVQVAIAPAGDAATASGELYLERTHPAADVSAALARAGLAEVAVQPQPGRQNVVEYSGKVPGTPTAEEVALRIRAQIEGFKDTTGRPFTLLSPIPESTVIGPQVGGELRDRAVIAVLLGMLMTVLFVRVRFAEYSYGIAVLAALAHDVLFVIGGLAVATMIGGLQTELDLTMIAAFLTIIGFSQNDTIVTFDRVRENRRHSKKPLREILNDSINQTLARTMITSLTVFLTLIVLFVFNVGTRNVLEAFSFAMLVGVISGVYSTVYIACPVLLWFEKRAARKAEQERGGPGAGQPLAA